MKPTATFHSTLRLPQIISQQKPGSGESVKERHHTGIKEPGKYNVIFHNDDFTPMDFVTMVLKHIFHKSEFEAETLMLKVHHEGKAVAGTYTYDIAVTKATDATNVARDNGFPLRISVNKA